MPVAEDMPITVGLVLQALPVLTGLALLWLAISRRITAEFDRTRAESEQGRQRLHQRIDRLEDDLDRNFVRRAEHDADMRALHHALEEQARLVSAVAGRFESKEIER